MEKMKKIEIEMVEKWRSCGGGSEMAVCISFGELFYPFISVGTGTRNMGVVAPQLVRRSAGGARSANASGNSPLEEVPKKSNEKKGGNGSVMPMP